MQIITDFGSGNTCKNDKKIVKKMIDELAKVDLQRKCIIKWQLFEKAGDNIPLDIYVFDYAYEYAKAKGFKTTASVFDRKNLTYLLEYKVPFVKIANRRDLYWLANKVPKEIPVYISYDNEAYLPPLMEHDKKLYCISKYPARVEDYGLREDIGYFGGHLYENISDHTDGNRMMMFYKDRRCAYEKHYVLKHDTKNPDGGPWAITPQELKCVLQ